MDSGGLYSQTLIEGTWTGKNVLGYLLVDVRTDLIREEEAIRLRSPPSPIQRQTLREQGHIHMDISEPKSHNTRLL